MMTPGDDSAGALLGPSVLDALYRRFGLRLACRSAHGTPIWRSRVLADASADDLHMLAELDLADVWDLRTDDERLRAPVSPSPGTRVHVMPGRLYPPNPDSVHGADVPDIPGTPGRAGDVLAEQIGRGDVGRGLPGERMSVIYRNLGENASMLVPVVRSLLVATRPTLVCCTSGKDRTGVVCFCAQRALGVSHEDALADYLATNVANAEVNAADLRALARRGISPQRLEVARSLFCAREEYLDAFLGAVVQAWGSFEAYLDECRRGLI